MGLSKGPEWSSSELLIFCGKNDPRPRKPPGAIWNGVERLFARFCEIARFLSAIYIVDGFPDLENPLVAFGMAENGIVRSLAQLRVFAFSQNLI